MHALIHVQHLTGVGHHVRAMEIARALSRAHTVSIIDGGRPVPRRAVRDVRRVPLPTLVREPDGLASLGADPDVPALLDARRKALADEVAARPPDVLVVEHYPFGKWELEGEISELADAVRTANPRAVVTCSLRDIWTERRHEGSAEHTDYVIDLLGRHFDALLVHADPDLVSLADHFPACDALPVPMFTTGIVSERVRAPGASAGPPPRAVLSVGGGAGSERFARCALEAWRSLVRAEHQGGQRLVVFEGVTPFGDDVRALTRHPSIELRPFGPAFLDTLAAAELSISRAGYNTCANLLETGVPAVLVPDPDMADQAIRAARFASRGLAAHVEPDDLTVERLAAAIAKAGRMGRRRHAFDLDGAEGTRRRLEALIHA